MRPRALAGLLLIACSSTGSKHRSGPGDSGAPDTDTADSGTDGGPDSGTDSGEDTSEPAGPCPRGMVLVNELFCIDTWEAALEEQDEDESWILASPYLVVGDRVVRAVSEEGLIPQGYISGDEAEAACAQSGKRLCTTAEWMLACQGPDTTLYPYGNEHEVGACNDDYEGGHPVIDYFGTSEGVWDGEHMNDPGINQQPGTVAGAGAHPDCRSAWGVLDLHGNLHEWVQDADGTFRGGFYADASINGVGCTYVTTAHTRDYHDYSNGFRCCAEPR